MSHAVPWRRLRPLLLVFAAAVALFAAPGAGRAQVAECRALAADSAQDPSRIRGVPFAEINAPRAMAACREALKTAPDDPAVQFQYARSLHKGNLFTQARRLYESAAEVGYAPAQQNLALMYANGDGVQQDGAKALRYYLQAAELKHLPAMHAVGLMYVNGTGIPGDIAEGLRWLERAAEADHLDSIYALGQLYWNGIGVRKNEREAYRRFQYVSARTTRHPDATYMVAVMLENGIGVERHCGWAKVNLHGAADAGSQPAQARVEAVRRGASKFCHDPNSARWTALLAGVLIIGGALATIDAPLHADAQTMMAESDRQMWEARESHREMWERNSMIMEMWPKGY